MADADAFDLLVLSPTFDLDPSAIQRAYFARSASLHPDIAAGNPDAQRHMALLNQAKRTLEDPEHRARALLARLNGPGPEDRSLPEGFLMEIMEVREEIEDALTDNTRRAAARAKWEAWAEDRRAEAIKDVGALFRALPDPPPTDSLRAIRTRLNAWRYIERLIEQLDPDYDPQRADFEA